MSEQNNESNSDVEACGPGCGCGASGAGSSRMKWVVSGVVLLAAAVVVAAHVARQQAADGQKGRQEFAAVIPAPAPGEAAMPSPVTAEVSAAWGAPLSALAELNLVATNTQAVFVVVPAGDTLRLAAIQKEVSIAAATITSRGTPMGTFLLSRDAPDYVGLTRQMAVPAVLVLYKGRGMAAVADGQINQEELLKAFVGSSRPPAAGCGPSGCGPDASGCN